MNVTSTASTTAVNCSVATSSLEYLSNDGEKPKTFVSKIDYGKISVKRAFSLVAYKFLWRYSAK